MDKAMAGPVATGTWEDLLTKILPEPLSCDFPGTTSSTANNSATAFKGWTAVNLPGPENTPLFVRVDPSLESRLLQGLRRGIGERISTNLPPELTSDLKKCFNNWKNQALPAESAVIFAFASCIQSTVQRVVGWLVRPSGADTSVTFDPSPRRWSQKVYGALIGSKVQTAETSSPITKVTTGSSVLEFKSLRVLLKDANLLDRDCILPQGKPVEGAFAILIKHTLQLAAAESRFGIMSAGYCGYYTELVRLDDHRGLALLISPLRCFTAAGLPPELVSDRSTDEIERAKPPPIIAVLVAMVWARNPGYEVPPTGASLEMPEVDGKVGSEEGEPVDDGSSSENQDSDRDDECSFHGKRNRASKNSKKAPGPVKKRGSRTSHVSSQLGHELNAGILEHQLMVSFLNLLTPSTPVSYRRLSFAWPPCSPQLSPGVQATPPVQTIPPASVTSERPDLLVDPPTPPPFSDPSAGLRNIVLSELVSDTDNSTVWKGLAERIDGSGPLQIIFKFVSGKALSLVKREIEIYETAYVEDVMPRYYGAWMREEGVAVGVLLERIECPLEDSRGEITKLSQEEKIQLQRALRMLHKKGIMHGDFYPRNVGRRDDDTFCIFDFGWSSFHHCAGRKRCEELRQVTKRFK